MTPRLVWLASFPKSGNTWLRALLSAYLFGPQDPGEQVRIAALGGHFAARPVFDSVLGMPSAYLRADELDELRPQVWREVGRHAQRTRFIKTHDQWRRGAGGESIFPADATLATVVVVRNPLAVAPSWAHHSGIDLDHAIAGLSDADAGLSQSLDRLGAQLPQLLGSWSDHVRSWLDQPELAVLLVRYEDLSADPAGELRRVLTAAQIDVVDERVATAVASCAFEVLAEREARQGFREQSRRGQPFFRQGRTDAWRDELSGAQVERIVAAHGPVMNRLGYET